MTHKTLNDIKPEKDRSKGSIPQVFHRHGKLTHNDSYIWSRTGTAMPIQTETLRMVAYGEIAAGDIMVRDNSNANKSLLHALRMAVSHRIMQEIGAHGKDVVLRQMWSEDNFGLHVYYAAIEAMAHYGTANQSSKLTYSKKVIRSRGFRRQANMLKSFIESGIEMAFDCDHDGLDWFYREFHSLYGTEQNPDPGMPPKEPDEDDDPVDSYSIDPPVSGNISWGYLGDICKAPMTPWKHPHIRSKSSWKYSEFGTFKYPWRALPSSDYQCFSLQRRKYGGTLLIDMSGSMSIKQEEVERILYMAPYATIACYGSGTNTQFGNIVIIAEDSKKGEAAFARVRIGGGNVIDGPALRWLAAQERPRIWVSDGVVTGVGDHACVALFEEAEQICHSANIIRIHSLEKLISQLTS